METLYDYRLVWLRQPWLMVYAALVVAVFALGIVGTVIGGPLAICFVPALGGAYLHHLMVQKRIS